MIQPHQHIRSLGFISLVYLLSWILYPINSTGKDIPQASDSTYYIDNSQGNDDNDGHTPETSWKTLSKANNTFFMPGNIIFLKNGEIWQDSLSITSSGTPDNPIHIKSYGTGKLHPILNGIVIKNADYIILEDLKIDRNKIYEDALKIRNSVGTIIRRIEAKNGTKNGFDIARAKKILIEDCRIHHFLGGSFTSQVDAHGIVVSKSQNIIIRNIEIHHVSGDSFQADPSRDPSTLTNDILIENCTLWTGPLSTDFNWGWVKTDHLPKSRQQFPGENAIDTKVLQTGWENKERLRIKIHNITAYGWMQDKFINNKAVFNLKEFVDVDADGITVHDSEIGFRIRGTRGNANVTIKNAVFHNLDKAIRAEDNLHNLKIFQSTFGKNIIRKFDFSGGDKGTNTWELTNNAFVGEKPRIAPRQSNLTVKLSALNDTFIDPERGDYHLTPNSFLIDAGIKLQNIFNDRTGGKRIPPYDVGAYEF